MANGRSFAETTSADKKTIGFEYQYLFFLYKLLDLKVGELIGLEVKDDLHIETPAGIVLMQAKHTLQQNTSGGSQNLTTKDEDMWKSIYNWVKFVNDEAEGRNTKKKQLEFMHRIRLVLVTNKADNQVNKFLSSVRELQSNQILIKEFRDFLVKLSTETTPPQKGKKNVKTYIDELIKQDDEWMEIFISKLEFELNTDDLITKIKNKLLEKMIPENVLDDVLNVIYGRLRKEYFLVLKDGGKFQITFEEFRTKYRKYFDMGKGKVPIRKVKNIYDGDVLNQLFIKQLVDLGDVDVADISTIWEMTAQRLSIENNLDTWIQNGELTPEQIGDFNRISITHWKNRHRKAHRTTVSKQKLNAPDFEDANLQNGLECLDELRTVELLIDEETTLDVEMSNGQFYSLSNMPEIGWLFDWEERYKK